jgi:hypothetical protein
LSLKICIASAIHLLTGRCCKARVMQLFQSSSQGRKCECFPLILPILILPIYVQKIALNFSFLAKDGECHVAIGHEYSRVDFLSMFVCSMEVHKLEKHVLGIGILYR